MSPEYSPGLLKKIDELVVRYPKKEAALLPVLRLIQDEVGAIGRDEEMFVGRLLGIRPIRVREVATFYSMILSRPAGRYHIQVCRNLSCSLLGAGSILEYLQEKLGIGIGETTPDGRYTLSTVECLGACDMAPCLMVNSEYYGPVDRPKIDEILSRLK